MAETNVSNNPSTQQTSQSNQDLQTQNSGLQQNRGGLARTSGGDPFAFALNPAEFFNNPFAAMRRMSEEMDRTFGRFFGGQAMDSSGGALWYPAVEINEKDGQLQVCAELPGLKPEDVKVEIHNDALIIQGERKYENEHHIGRAHRSERRYGQFYREIALPEGVNAEQANAQFRDGILEVTVPMPQTTNKRRQIPIQSGSSSASATISGTSAAAAGAGAQSGSNR